MAEIEWRREDKGDLRTIGPESRRRDSEVKQLLSTAERDISGRREEKEGRAKGVAPFLALENAIDPVAVLALHALSSQGRTKSSLRTPFGAIQKGDGAGGQ